MNRTFPIGVQVANPEGTLKPEMVARVEVTRARLEDALVVPQNAVLLDETGRSVFVVTRPGGQPTAEQRDVTTGATYAGRIVITSGIEAGEEIIILGQTNLTPGDAVEIVRQATLDVVSE